MRAEDVIPGSKVWYSYTIPGNGMTGQEQVEVLEVRNDRAKIKRQFGKPVWVKVKNLHPTN